MSQKPEPTVKFSDVLTEWDSMPEIGLEKWPVYVEAGPSELAMASLVSALMTVLARSQIRGTVSGPDQAKEAKELRSQITQQLQESPDLDLLLSDREWLDCRWSRALTMLGSPKGSPIESPWSKAELLRDDWPSPL